MIKLLKVEVRSSMDFAYCKTFVMYYHENDMNLYGLSNEDIKNKVLPYNKQIAVSPEWGEYIHSVEELQPMYIGMDSEVNGYEDMAEVKDFESKFNRIK